MDRQREGGYHRYPSMKRGGDEENRLESGETERVE